MLTLSMTSLAWSSTLAVAQTMVSPCRVQTLRVQVSSGSNGFNQPSRDDSASLEAKEHVYGFAFFSNHVMNRSGPTSRALSGARTFIQVLPNNCNHAATVPADYD